MSRAASLDLLELVELFHESPAELGRFEPVASSQVPQVYRSLLDHDQHMTVTVEAHHGCPVDVEVMEFKNEAGIYSRKILLTRQSDRRMVQFGIVRLHLCFLSDVVRQEIASRVIPLGRVLIEHNVMRRVELGQLWLVTPGPELCRLFRLPAPVDTYGRTAIIHCNGEPAVELLEIVAPEPSSPEHGS